MARPKQGVTSKNLLHVENYFSRAFQFDRLRGQGWFESEDAYYDAKEAYKKLPHFNWTTKDTRMIDKRCMILQKWIDKHIANEKWQRCLLTLRQAKSRKKLKLRQLNLKSDVYLTVKILAKKKGITMSDVVKKLAEPALKKIYDAEFASEFKYPKHNIKSIVNKKTKNSKKRK